MQTIQNRNGSRTEASIERNMMLEATDKLLQKVEAAGHRATNVNVRVYKNPKGMPHVHATTSVRVVFQATVQADEAATELA